MSKINQDYVSAECAFNILLVLTLLLVLPAIYIIVLGCYTCTVILMGLCININNSSNFKNIVVYYGRGIYLCTGPVTFDVDEHPRPQTTMETLGKLPAVFQKNGTVTAGNASVSYHLSVLTLFKALCIIKCLPTVLIVLLWIQIDWKTIKL